MNTKIEEIEKLRNSEIEDRFALPYSGEIAKPGNSTPHQPGPFEFSQEAVERPLVERAGRARQASPLTKGAGETGARGTGGRETPQARRRVLFRVGED